MNFRKMSILAVAMLVALVGSMAIVDSADAGCGYGGYGYTSYYSAPSYVAAPVYKVPVTTYYAAPTYHRPTYVVPSCGLHY